MSAWRVLGMPRSNRLSLSVSMRSCRASRGRRGCGVRPATQRRTGPFATRTCRCVSGDAPLALPSYESSTASRHGARTVGLRASGVGRAARRPPSRYRVGLCRLSGRRSSRNHSVIPNYLAHAPPDEAGPDAQRRSSRATTNLEFSNFAGPLRSLLPTLVVANRLTFLSEASQRRRPCRGGRAPRSAYWRGGRRSALPRH